MRYSNGNTYHKWVLVADGGAARIFQKNKTYEEIHQVRSKYQHSTSKELVTDKDGAFYATRHHTKGNASDQHAQAEKAFIQSVADYLKQSYLAGAFHEIRIMMPPKAMGSMRKCLDSKVKHVVKQEILKDYTHIKSSEIVRKILADL
ncbi:host attachment protein [Marinicella sp. W31]|uniref:host attachment protein n=1 Tax=Marinicella sp. W31 TaxID=3023713 RepID=UPI0037573FD8